MFKFDKPISSKKEDFLSRKKFSSHLGDSLLTWREKESLVIALNGEWGSGKSSVINLAKEYIQNSTQENKPTIIEFNPWVFSDLDNLSQYFFNEIAKELEIKSSNKKDQKIAHKLKLYAKLLNIVPTEKTFFTFSSKILLGLGILSISTSQITQWISSSPNWMTYMAFGLGLLLFLLGLFKDFLFGLSDYFSQKIISNKKSISELKGEIKEELTERKNKLIIVIDDIDRLNQSEIRQIFRLVRVNADFPNTIYLLAFDRDIVEKNLEEQIGISGKEYLEKIIQVNFDIPLANADKISHFLFKELNRILDTLPENHEKLFDQNYWANIYHSGFGLLFKNIRDVKRFSSGLQFNISQMHQNDIMEVNPIDFIAIESIRLFTPGLYKFIKNKKDFFTGTESSFMGMLDEKEDKKEKKKKEIKEELNKLDQNTRNNIKKLLCELFPQTQEILNVYGGDYGHEWQSTWSKELRICSTKNFDSYFTFIPGGNETELSQYEIEEILSSMRNANEIELLLNKYIEENKIKKVLERIQNYTNDIEKIPQENVQNLVQALFNVSDNIPQDDDNFFELDSDMEIMRIIYQLFKREDDKNKNYEVLKNTIPDSKSIFTPIQKISLEMPDKNGKEKTRESTLPESKLAELQQLCVLKIQEFDKEKLLKHKKFIRILYAWKEWGSDEELKYFISKTNNNPELFWLFINGFISESKTQSSGDYSYKIKKKFLHENLSDFLNPEEVKNKMEKAKKNTTLYTKNKEVIDLFFYTKDNEDE